MYERVARGGSRLCRCVWEPTRIGPIMHVSVMFHTCAREALRAMWQDTYVSHLCEALRALVETRRLKCLPCHSRTSVRGLLRTMRATRTCLSSGYPASICGEHRHFELYGRDTHGSRSALYLYLSSSCLSLCAGSASRCMDETRTHLPSGCPAGAPSIMMSQPESRCQTLRLAQVTGTVHCQP
jgi:hypothetical protein